MSGTPITHPVPVAQRTSASPSASPQASPALSPASVYGQELQASNSFTLPTSVSGQSLAQPAPTLVPFSAPPRVSSMPQFRAFCLDSRQFLQSLAHPALQDSLAKVNNLLLNNTLPRIDTITSLVDSYHANTGTISQSLAHIQALTASDLPLLYQRIDRLTDYVTSIEQCCQSLEQRLTQAEDAYLTVSATTKLAKFFSSGGGGGSPSGSSEKSVSTEPIEIVSAEDFFLFPTTASADAPAPSTSAVQPIAAQ